jgi:hypothetical protein
MVRPRSYDLITDGLLDAADAILLDNSAPDRLGRGGPGPRARFETLCIDPATHARTPWALNIIDTSASATAVLVYELVRGGWIVRPSGGDALYP